MQRCKNCGEIVKTRMVLKCERNNCKLFSKKINRIERESLGLDERNKIFDRIEIYIQNKSINDKITVFGILKDFDMIKDNNGECIRQFLDILTCMGKLKKIFRPAGLHGNKYYKINDVTCKYLSYIKNKTGESLKRKCLCEIFEEEEYEKEDFIRKCDTD